MILVKLSKEQSRYIAQAIVNDIGNYIEEHLEQYDTFLKAENKKGDDTGCNSNN